jgi:hypothetical protein
LALSLDAVKVVRNDLSDCDVEFVAKKQKAVSGKQKADYETTGLQDDGTTGLLTNERADGKPEVPHTESALREGGALNAAWGRATRVFGAAFVRAASTDLVEKS